MSVSSSVSWESKESACYLFWCCIPVGHLFISILSTAQPPFQQRSTLLSQNCLVSISKRSFSLVTLFLFAWFFFSRCLTFPWAPFSPFSLIASVLPASPFLSYPGVYLCTRSFYFSYGFKCLPSLSPPSVPFFVFVFLFPRGPSTLLSSLLSVCFHTSCFYLNLTSRWFG